MPTATSLVRLLTAAALPLALATSAPPPLRPGAWTFTNTPTAASLDGRPLHDLPVGAVTSETVCLTPDLAARPGRWLARDLLQDCTLEKEVVAGGRVAIAGTCPARSAGQAPGSIAITGQYTPTTYNLTFATTSPDENGAMRFDGRMRGRRTGTCR